jgi:hypothetical protein
MTISTTSSYTEQDGVTTKDLEERDQSISSIITDEKESSQDLNALEKGEPLSNESIGPAFSVFDRRTRIFIIVMVAVSALISPFAATLYFPALTPLADQLHVSNSLINLTITTYMVSSIYIIVDQRLILIDLPSYRSCNNGWNV